MNILKETIRSIPGFYKCIRFLKDVVQIDSQPVSPFLQTYPSGHYYSPIPDMAQILDKEDILFKRDVKTCLGVDLREDAQLELLEKLAVYYSELPFPEQPDSLKRYYFDNHFFSYADAIILYSMLRHFKPRNVIEVGSGFSSAVMLDINDTFLDDSVSFTFVEPFPDRLNKLITKRDTNCCAIVAKTLQDVECELFDTLNTNDILFIDSSHVLKVGSDVARIFFEILPKLKRGVMVHFHDILWPFEYPKEWFIEGRAWNEAYALRVFLQFNNVFEILYFNSYMGHFYRKRLQEKMPLCLRNTGGSLWLKKVV